MRRTTVGDDALGRLRGAALGTALAGAAGSVALMLRAGRHQPSGLLLALFGEWVLAPFVALAAAATASVRWAALTRVTLYGLTLLVA
ncbi:MAG TPA: hypothetical protein VGD56_13450, partial [Gemmatirosa sp.]